MLTICYGEFGIVWGSSYCLKLRYATWPRSVTQCNWTTVALNKRKCPGPARQTPGTETSRVTSDAPARGSVLGWIVPRIGEKESGLVQISTATQTRRIVFWTVTVYHNQFVLWKYLFYFTIIVLNWFMQVHRPTVDRWPVGGHPMVRRRSSDGSPKSPVGLTGSKYLRTC